MKKTVDLEKVIKLLGLSKEDIKKIISHCQSNEETADKQ